MKEIVKERLLKMPCILVALHYAYETTAAEITSIVLFQD